MSYLGQAIAGLAAAVNTHVAAVVAHGASGAVVGTTNTQTLSNKTLVAGTVIATGGDIAGRYFYTNDGSNGIVSAGAGGLYLRTAGGANTVVMDVGTGGLLVTAGPINALGNLLFSSAPNSPGARLAFPQSTGPKICLYDSGGGSFYGFGVNGSEMYASVPASAAFTVRQGGGAGTIMFNVTGAGNVQSNSNIAGASFTAAGAATTGYAFETLNSGAPGGRGLANAWTVYSSADFKTDVRTMTDGIASLKRLRPVTYKHKASGDPSIGLIAEEVAEVYPQIVAQDDDGRLVGLDYGRLIAPVMSALLEVIDRVEALEKRSKP